MVDKIDKRAVNAILYGMSASVRQLFGAGADAVMRIAGPMVLEEFAKQGVEFSGTDSASISSELKKAMLDMGMCDEISIEETDTHYNIDIKGCSFWEATLALRDLGIKPFACPFANLTMTLLEKNAGQKTTIENIEPTGDAASLVSLKKV